MRSVVFAFLCVIIYTVSGATHAATTQSKAAERQGGLEFDGLSYLAPQASDEDIGLGTDGVLPIFVRRSLNGTATPTALDIHMMARRSTSPADPNSLFQVQERARPDRLAVRMLPLNSQNLFGFATKTTGLPLSFEVLRAAAAGRGGNSNGSSSLISAPLPAGLPVLFGAIAVLGVLLPRGRRLRPGRQRWTRPMTAWTRPVRRIFYRKHYARTLWCAQASTSSSTILQGRTLPCQVTHTA